ncbi:MAG: hypothetical protein U0746_19700 [Gemmataceae bacterium]
MPTATEWSLGYARQADADFRSWERLRRAKGVPECHCLLFLQMACEKLTKAHLCRAGTPPALLQTSHAYTAKNLPVIVRQQVGFSALSRRSAGWVNAKVKPLAREIELLAPAVSAAATGPTTASTRGPTRPASCGCRWTGRSCRRNCSPRAGGRVFLKLIRDAIDRFLA